MAGMYNDDTVEVNQLNLCATEYAARLTMSICGSLDETLTFLSRVVFEAFSSLMPHRSLIMARLLFRSHCHMGAHHHHHHHDHAAPDPTSKAFAVGVVLNLIFVAVEVIYGLRANSLS